MNHATSFSIHILAIGHSHARDEMTVLHEHKSCSRRESDRVLRNASSSIEYSFATMQFLVLVQIHCDSFIISYGKHLTLKPRQRKRTSHSSFQRSPVSWVQFFKHLEHSSVSTRMVQIVTGNCNYQQFHSIYLSDQSVIMLDELHYQNRKLCNRKVFHLDSLNT